MERNEFRKVCQAIEEGEEITLENLDSHENGRLLYCSTDEFQVDVEGKREKWMPERCEEISRSSESPHGNI